MGCCTILGIVLVWIEAADINSDKANVGMIGDVGKEVFLRIHIELSP